MQNKDGYIDEQYKNNQKLERKPRSLFTLVLVIFLMVLIIGGLIWFLIFWQSPMSEELDLSDIPTRLAPTTYLVKDPTAIVNPAVTPLTLGTFPYVTPTQSYAIQAGENLTIKEPLCGNVNEMMILLVGLDYEKPDPAYLYGLADVIRLVHVDFTTPRVNIVSLPRALLVDIIPEHYSASGPILINQAYLFGAPGMGFYNGSGFGAGSLAETIKYNFGISVDHYLVVNFTSFVRFIDAIGGIDIDLPTYIDDRPRGYFPPGLQHLDGERTLYLARIREKYSDLVRINDQSLILGAIFQRLKNPAILSNLLAIYESFQDSIITDVSPSLIEDAYCLFKKTSGNDLHFYDPYFNVMTYDWAYIPSLNRNMDVFYWDQHFLDWLNFSLWATGDD